MDVLLQLVLSLDRRLLLLRLVSRFQKQLSHLPPPKHRHVLGAGHGRKKGEGLMASATLALGLQFLLLSLFLSNHFRKNNADVFTENS